MPAALVDYDGPQTRDPPTGWSAILPAIALAAAKFDCQSAVACGIDSRV